MFLGSLKVKWIQLACFLSVLLLPTVSFAAAPVTHAILAEKWIAAHEHYNDEQKRAFILGTLFPDIRYLGVISRSETHEKGVTVQKLKDPQTEFCKGRRLHSLVDKARENCVVRWKIYQKLANIPGRKATFLKLLEDEILFNRMDWKHVRRYLSYLHPEEQAYGIRDEDLRRWHTNQTRAFRAPPSVYLKYLAMFGMGFAKVPKETTYKWSKLLPQYAKDPEMQAYVEKLVQEFDNLYAQ